MATTVEDQIENGRPASEDPAGEGWRTDAKGREFAPARGRSGVVYRQGNETIDEAHARDAKGPRDRPPKAKPRSPKPPAPTKASLKELEFLLTETLRAPSLIPAGMGDEWPASHLVTHAPIVARNLTKAAEFNPWLRSKLEAAMTGEDFAIKFMTMATVAGAMFMYAVPPILYYVNPNRLVSVESKRMFGVPDRPKREKPDAESPEPAEAAAAAGRPATGA